MGTMKGQGLMWKDLKIQQVEAYMALKSSQDRLSFLRQHAKDGLPADQDRADIVLDLYYYALQFGMQQAFTADKLSVLYSIMRETFHESMNKFLTAKASFNYFRDLLLQHSVQRPPFSVGLFALQGFMQPLSAGEDEPTKLKREEAERLEALKEPQVEVTKEDLDNAKVPPDLQEVVLEKVNAQIAELKAKMEADMEAKRKEMESRIAALQAQVRGT